MSNISNCGGPLDRFSSFPGEIFRDRNPEFVCAHTLFEEVAASNPDNVAIIHDGGRLTFRELNEKANAVAHAVLDQAPAPESVVAIFVDRSVETLIACLAVLKAGCAFVALEPTEPFDHIQHKINDSQSFLILGDGKSISQFCEISITSIESILEDYSEHVENPSVEVSLNDLAYIIYTSGSTGKPKGVMNEHRVVVHSLSFPNLTGRTAILNFVHAIWEYLPVARDQTSIIVSEDTLHDPNRLLELLNFCNVNNAILVPTLLNVILTEIANGACLPRQLLNIYVTGEPLSSDLVKKFYAVFPDCNLYNCFGATEYWDATEYRASIDDSCMRVPVGVSIPNTQIHILDENLSPVPDGAIGEIFVTGALLSRGYLNQPKLTAEKFLPNPFNNGFSRLYRTGDLGRKMDDGNLIHLGRKDNQVKVRGRRVELEEVENALLAIEGVLLAAAVPHTVESGNSILLGYVTQIPGTDLDANEIRCSLLRTQPAYLVPDRIKVLTEMPLTSTGKLDRKRLPTDFAEDRSSIGTPYVAPETGLQKLVASIWAEKLDLDTVGLHDNFFGLGGDSLKSIEILSALGKAVGKKIPAKLLVHSGTVFELAEQVAQLLDRDADGAAPEAPGEISREQPHVLSFGQESLWLIEQMSSTGDAYHVPLGFRLKGKLCRETFERAWLAVLERHVSLRRKIEMIDGVPASVSIPLADADWETKQIRDGGRQFHACIDYQTLCELAQIEPNLLLTGGTSSRLIELNEENHLFVVLMHHAFVDEYSCNVILSDLSVCYAGFLKSRDWQPGPPPVDYAAFANAERRRFADGRLDSGLDHWLKQLRAAPPELGFQPAAGDSTPNGGCETFNVSLSSGVRDRVRAFLNLEGLSESSFFVGALQMLLANATGRRDVTIGVSASNRLDEDFFDVVGYFANLIVLTGTVEQHRSVRHHLSTVHARLLEGLAHQDVPFSRVVEALNPPRFPDRVPFADVIFTFHNARNSQFELPGLDVSEMTVKRRNAQTLLAVDLEIIDGEYQFGYEYNNTYLDEHFVSALAAQFESLLERLVRDPACSVESLFLEDLSNQKAGGVAEVPSSASDKCLHTLFEDQVDRTPFAVAVRDKGREISYEELDHRAEQIASGLIARGLDAGQTVALDGARSIDAIVCLLGIMKAGGVFLPVDLSEPAFRNRQILARADARLLITFGNDGNCSSFIEAVECDALRASRSGHPRTAKRQVTPDSGAYILFTSGSTGVPKGVCVSHRAIVNYLVWFANYFEAFQGSGAPLHTSLCVDIALPTVFAPLLTGNAVHVLAEGYAVSSLAEQFGRDRDYSFVSLTSSQLKMISTLVPKNRLAKTARHIIFGSDFLSREDLQFWMDAAPQTSFHNEYGCTETTVANCVNSFDKVASAGDVQNIGRPIPNTVVRIMNKLLQPVPAGVPGEICIGGRCIGKFYVSDPRQTALQFVPDLSDASGERLYRTGDLGVALSDGTIRLLGRMDSQLKVQGRRVEPGEIAAVLENHHGVARCHVAVDKSNESTFRLVAYVQCRSGYGFDTAELAAYMRDQLPAYMVPAVFVPVTDMPLGRTGKIDPTRLPAVSARSELETGIGPTSWKSAGEIEIRLKSVWSEVLGRDDFGLEQSFFNLGGDSIKAAEVLAKARNAGLHFRLEQIFQFQTIRELAAVCLVGRTGNEPRPVRSNVVCERADPEAETTAPLTPAQATLLCRDIPGKRSGVTVLQVTYAMGGHLDIDRLRAAWSSLLRAHPAFRARFSASAARWDGHAGEGRTDFRFVDLSALPKEEQQRETARLADGVVTAFSERGNFGTAHALLVRTAGNVHFLTLSLDHIAADGWTLSVAIENLFALYDQPGTRICDEYIDYCNFLFKKVAEFDVHHWRRVLDGFVPGGSVTDTCRPIKSGLSADKAREWPRLPLDAPETLRAGIEHFIKTSNVTESAIYSMIWGLILGEHSGSGDVTFGTTVSGRHHDYENVSGIAGCFAQALPSRLIFSPEETPRGLVKKAMKEQARLLEQQASRLSDIEEAAGVQKDASLFDTVLTFQNYPENAPCTCNIDISFLDYRQYSLGGRPPVELKIEPGANDMFVIEFDDERVPGDVAHALGSRFVQVLSEVLDCPDKQLSEFKILGNVFKNNKS